ncbi:MAG: thiamine phosphate synthase [Campylobacterales bacterium]|nr:thiamine phosphate synthase [Campylobacterales bacterium]
MIYALIDKETLEKKSVSLADLLKNINNIKATILQYRNKVDSLEEIRSDLVFIRSHYQGKIIINDRIELIEYADGLHVGQEDLYEFSSDPQISIEKIREQIGHKLLGLSTHNIDEILVANELDVDYIGLGAYRTTGTKADAQVYGDELLHAAKHSKHPVALIGGVRMDDIFDESITYKVVGSGLY